MSNSDKTDHMAAPTLRPPLFTNEQYFLSPGCGSFSLLLIFLLRGSWLVQSYFYWLKKTLLKSFLKWMGEILKLQQPSCLAKVWQKIEHIKRSCGDWCENVPICAMYADRKKKKNFSRHSTPPFPVCRANVWHSTIFKLICSAGQIVVDGDR